MTIREVPALIPCALCFPAPAEPGCPACAGIGRVAPCALCWSRGYHASCEVCDGLGYHRARRCGFCGAVVQDLLGPEEPCGRCEATGRAEQAAGG